MAGDCYQINSLLAVQLDGTLCHGIVIGTGHPVLNVPYGHAWVEHEDPETGVVLVHDHSNGVELVVPIIWFYLIGRINPETVARYTVREMSRHQLDHEHFGPWADHLVGHL